MRLTLITQSDPFFLAENIDYLIKHLPSHSQIVNCILFDVSPFGKRENFLQKAKRTLNIFGTGFFLHYTYVFLRNKLNKNKDVEAVLTKHQVPVTRLSESINSEHSLGVISNYQPDLLVSIAGNQIFKKKLLQLAPKGCVNLHTALLPRYRGLMPSFWVLKNGENKTGVSVFFVDEGIDSGPIITQKEIEIGNMTQFQLISISKKIGMDAIVETVEKIHTNEYTLIDNPEENKTYYTFPTRADVKEFFKRGKRFF